jgi:hypothetical protein
LATKGYHYSEYDPGMPYRWYHTSMRKTTVYLEDEEADGIRRLAAETGKSQADLIREGVRRVLRRSPNRKFHSMGIGEAAGKQHRVGWTPSEVYRKAFGLDRR